MTDRDFRTSAVLMLEIAERDLESVHPKEELHEGPEPVAPSHERERPVPVNTHAHVDRYPSLAQHQPSSLSTNRVESDTTGFPANLLERGEKTFDWLSDKSDVGKKISDVLVWGKIIVLDKFPDLPRETRRKILRVILAVSKTGKYLEKATEHFDTVSKLFKLATNVHRTYHQMTDIVHSDILWPEKAERLGVHFSAVLLRTVAEGYLDTEHSVVQTVRTAAAMAGADVSHPSFGNHSIFDPRTYLSWQAINFFDTRLNYLAETVYSGDNIYVLVHTHVDERLNRRNH